MIKDPNEPLDPKDRLRLPTDFGTSAPPKVLPFGKRKEPPQVSLVPPKEDAPVIDYHLTGDEVRALQAYLNDRTSALLQKDLRGPPVEPEDNPLTMLKQLIQDIEHGKIHPAAVFVGMIDYKHDGTEDYPFYCTGMSRMALRGLLHEYLENLP
jgi:hypothetical protein